MLFPRRILLDVSSGVDFFVRDGNLALVRGSNLAFVLGGHGAIRCDRYYEPVMQRPLLCYKRAKWLLIYNLLASF